MTIEHAALYVEDLEAARDFFVTYFGGTAGGGYRNEQTEFRSYFITFAGGARLEVMARPGVMPAAVGAPRTGWAHVAFSTGSCEAVDALTETLRVAGYTVESGPRTTGDGYYESVVCGVEGILVEITV